MKSTLLLISIGPVQDFIASARKLRDLWFGSYILSELSKTIARVLHENGAELIFPSGMCNLKENSSLNVANKIMAKVLSSEEADRLQKIAKSVWQLHFNKIADNTLNDIQMCFPKLNIKEDLFCNQCKDYGEYYAVWVDYTDVEYNEARNKVEKLLSARKNVRMFSTPTWIGTGIPKNSMDGMRETVIAEKLAEIPGLLKQNEKLDAMGCIKRFYPLGKELRLDKHFDDLADIALVPWLEGISNNDAIRTLLLKFQGTVPIEKNIRRSQRELTRIVQQPLISELYFLDKKNLTEVVSKEKIDSVWNARTDLYHKYIEPQPYSMILVGDGDNMGMMINSITTMNGHQKFTEKLSQFSKDVCKIVEDMGGSMVYAGGDDVMAYLPIHNGVECADKLRLHFYSLMKEIVIENKLTCAIPTFSIGIAIVHYLMPLDQALSLARKAEKIAKKKDGKNALAIIQNKRSGSNITICGKWDAQGDLEGIADRIDKICILYSNPDFILPSRLGYQLNEVLLTSDDKMEFKLIGDKVIPNNATAALVKRVFDGKNDGDEQKKKELIPLLAGRCSVRELADELIVVHQIYKVKSMANRKESK